MLEGTTISLTGPQAGMFDAWFSLYERYVTQAGGQPSRRSAGTLWRWLLDGTYRVAGVLALDAGKHVVGFAHYRPYPNTLDGSEGCWLDDLYVADAQRDFGLTERLIEHVCGTARRRGWSEVTWLDVGGNATRSVPNEIADRSPAALYRIAL